MILNEMANVVLASWIALYHFAAIYVWSTVRGRDLCSVTLRPCCDSFLLAAP